MKVERGGSYIYSPIVPKRPSKKTENFSDVLARTKDTFERTNPQKMSNTSPSEYSHNALLYAIAAYNAMNIKFPIQDSIPVSPQDKKVEGVVESDSAHNNEPHSSTADQKHKRKPASEETSTTIEED